MADLWQKYPVGGCILFALIFFVVGWVNYDQGSRRLAYVTWALGVITVSGGIVGYCLSFGIMRWPVAMVVLVAGMWAIWHMIKEDERG